MAAETSKTAFLFASSSITTRTPTTEDESRFSNDENCPPEPQSKAYGHSYINRGAHLTAEIDAEDFQRTVSTQRGRPTTRKRLVESASRVFRIGEKRMELVASASKAWLDWFTIKYGPNVVYLAASMILGFLVTFAGALLLVILGLTSGPTMLSFSPLLGPILGLIQWFLVFVYDVLRSHVLRISTMQNSDSWPILTLRFSIYFALSMCWYTAWLLFYFGVGGYIHFGILTTVVPLSVALRSVARLVLQTLTRRRKDSHSVLLSEIVHAESEFYGKCDVLAEDSIRALEPRASLRHTWSHTGYEPLDKNLKNYTELPTSSLSFFEQQFSNSAGRTSSFLLSVMIRSLVKSCFYLLDGIVSFAFVALLVLVTGHMGAAGYMFSHAIIFSAITTSMTQLSDYMRISLETYVIELEENMSISGELDSQHSGESVPSKESFAELDTFQPYRSKEIRLPVSLPGGTSERLLRSEFVP